MIQPPGPPTRFSAVVLIAFFACFCPTFSNPIKVGHWLGYVLFFSEQFVDRVPGELLAARLAGVEGRLLLRRPAENCHQLVVCRAVLGGGASLPQSMGRCTAAGRPRRTTGETFIRICTVAPGEHGAILARPNSSLPLDTSVLPLTVDSQIGADLRVCADEKDRANFCQ